MIADDPCIYESAMLFTTYAIFERSFCIYNICYFSEILKLAGANQLESAKVGRPWSSFCQILFCLLGCIVVGLQNLLKKLIYLEDHKTQGMSFAPAKTIYSNGWNLKITPGNEKEEHEESKASFFGCQPLVFRGVHKFIKYCNPPIKKMEKQQMTEKKNRTR